MERTVEKPQAKPQPRFRDGIYVTTITEVKEVPSDEPDSDGYILLSCSVNAGKLEPEKSTIVIPMRCTPKNKHGRFLSALRAVEIDVGMTYDPDKYVGGVFEAYWEWDAEKKRMRADKFRPYIKDLSE